MQTVQNQLSSEKHNTSNSIHFFAFFEQGNILCFRYRDSDN
jgi:hypothetical protein